MYIARLQLDGIRGFHGPRAVDLDFSRPDGSYSGWTVLAGRNGAGKTTLLRAIGLCLAGPQRALQLDDNLEDWLSSGLTTGRAEIGLAPADDGGLWNDSTLLRRGSITWSPARSPELSLFSEREAPEVAFQGRLPNWNLKRADRWLYAGYGPFRRLSGSSGLEGTSRRKSAYSASSMRTLFDEGAALTEAVDWLVRLHLYRYESRQGAAALMDAVIALLNDGLLPDGLVVSRVDSSGLWVRRSGDDEIPLHRMSDGYRSIVALVLDIISQLADAYGGRDVEKAIRSSGAPVLTLPGVVLIDEVDAHLHVSWQQRIGTWLKQHFPAVQFIVTSHSPYICQAADPNGLIRLAGPTDESAPEIVSDQLYRRVIYGTGDDAVLSDLFGLDTPYSADARELRGTLVRLEAKVVTGRASEAEATEYAALRNELSSSPATRVAEVAARLDGQDDPHAEGSADR